MYNGVEDDHISKMIKACEPLRVKVSVKTEDNCVVIYMDGRTSYTNSDNWESIWGGFSNYIHLLMTFHGVKYLSSTKLAENYYSANLGSVFDMIRNIAANEKG